MNKLNYNDNNKLQFECQYPACKADIFCIRYLNAYAVIGWLIILFLEIFFIEIPNNINSNFPVFSVQTGLPLVIIAGVIRHLRYHKLSYKIQFTKEIVRFFLFSSKKVIEYKISDLNEIKIGWFYHFRFKDGTSLRFLDQKGNDCIRFFEESRFKIKWGRLGRLKFSNYRKHRNRS